MSQLVYFIQASESGRVKIGIARDPVKRLAALQTGNPELLVLLGVTAGGAALEDRLHAQLEQDRLQGEWFECSDQVVRVMGDLLGWGTPTPPTPQQLESKRKADIARAELAQLRDSVAAR